MEELSASHVIPNSPFVISLTSSPAAFIFQNHTRQHTDTIHPDPVYLSDQVYQYPSSLPHRTGQNLFFCGDLMDGILMRRRQLLLWWPLLHIIFDHERQTHMSSSLINNLTVDKRNLLNFIRETRFWVVKI